MMKSLSQLAILGLLGLAGLSTAGNSEDWCDCGTGKSWLDVWDASNATASKFRITSANPQFVDFGDKYVPTVHWICDGMDNDIQTTTLGGDTKKWYVNLHTETKALCLPFGKDSGRISWETPGLE